MKAKAKARAKAKKSGVEKKKGPKSTRLSSAKSDPFGKPFESFTTISSNNHSQLQLDHPNSLSRLSLSDIRFEGQALIISSHHQPPHHTPTHIRIRIGSLDSPPPHPRHRFVHCYSPTLANYHTSAG